MTIISGAAFLAILQGEIPQTAHRLSRLTTEKKGHQCRYGPPVGNICELNRRAQCGRFLQNHASSYAPCRMVCYGLIVIADGLNMLDASEANMTFYSKEIIDQELPEGELPVVTSNEEA